MKKTITNEKLARMIEKGFESTDKRIDKRFNDVDKRFDRVENRLDILEQGHEEIKLKLDQVAYRFELDNLEKRVQKLELKLGLRKG